MAMAPTRAAPPLAANATRDSVSIGSSLPRAYPLHANPPKVRSILTAHGGKRLTNDEDSEIVIIPVPAFV
ncbi:hypothetical protein GCM10023096_40860 [Nonomuraea ferruginea]